MDSTKDGPPPLEDMTELLQQVTALRERKKNQQHAQNQTKQNGHSLTNGHSSNKTAIKQIGSATSVDTSDNKESKSENDIQSNTVHKQKISVNKGETNLEASKNSFGGMKKGFLFGGPPKSASNSKTNKKSEEKRINQTVEDIPFITKKETDKTESLKLTEVQEAMEKTNTKLMQNKEWVTDDLLQKIEKNDKLAKRLQNPMFLQAINEFQTNPQDAMKKYGSNNEVQEFFTEFCGLMGQHFNKLADKQGDKNQTASVSQPVVSTQTGSADISVRSSTNPKQPTAADEQKMQEILSDPNITEVLMDQKVQELFQCLRTDPEKGQRLLQTAPADFKVKIQKLVNAGLLQFK